MDEKLLHRINRMNVAVGRVETNDVRSVPAQIFSKNGRMLVLQDFSGGQTEAEISETLHALIHNIGSFNDHLVKYGERHGISKDTIHNFLKSSIDYCIIRDLWNNDKHEYPPNKDGWSKKAPMLKQERAVCELKTGNKVNSISGITMGRDGVAKPIVSGGGSTRVVLTGEVIDKNGGGIGEVHEIIERAVRVCEAAVIRFVT